MLTLPLRCSGYEGNDWDPTCMKMDETLYSIQEKIQNFAVIYLVDIVKVPDFNKVRLAEAAVASRVRIETDPSSSMRCDDQMYEREWRLLQYSATLIVRRIQRYLS